MYIVLVYDISQDEKGQRRWSRVFKICKKYLSHIQNSVFEGEISKAQLAKEKSVTIFFLEVRQSNEAAKKLYEKLGYSPIGTRKRFYERPVEDAIVMSKIL